MPDDVVVAFEKAKKQRKDIEIAMQNHMPPPRVENQPNYEKVEWDWRKMNIERPRAAWYRTADGAYYYLYYPSVKQFSRGYQLDHNCYLMSDRRSGDKKASDLYDVLCAAFNEPKALRQQVPLITMINAGSTTFQLSPQMLAVCNEGGSGSIYYRRIVVGIIDIEASAIHLLRPEFADEIREVVSGCKFAPVKGYA